MDETRWPSVERLLTRTGLARAADIASELGVNQSTVSRLLARAGGRVIRIGRARAARYALAREIARDGSHWPLYRIDAHGRSLRLGELHSLSGGRFWFESTAPRPAFLHGEFANGVFAGLPWFLDDQRPQGFLGRAFGRRVASDINAAPDILLWNADDILLALLRHGQDAPGDLVVGEASLQRALQRMLDPADGIRRDDRAAQYPQRAEAALRGENVGSSAGGEQPKFAITLVYGERVQPVIVKFSERNETPGAQRWADLLRCEHIAGTSLQAAGLPAADSEIFEAGDRVFLQSTRFDRTPDHGRTGFVSLYALDAAYYGHGRIDWWRFASELERDGWIDADSAHCLRLYGWFGTLIANSDMHLGNASLQLTDARPLRLLPAYDMLPMHFRPATSGEVVERTYEVVLPTPERRDDWHAAARIAREFWQRVADDARISAGFRTLADDAGAALDRAVRRS